MDSSSILLDEEAKEGHLPKNGLGFSGGPIWQYPEEEIEFYPVDQDDFLEEDSDIESCSCSSMDAFRIAMIENFMETHDDILEEDLDVFFGSERNVDYALSQPPPSVAVIEREMELTRNNDNDDDNNASDLSSSHHSFSNKRRLPEISPSSLYKKETSWLRPSSKRRKRPDKVCISRDATIIKDSNYHYLREATLYVPFEYTTKLATFYIRRPYGAITVPEIFRALSPSVTDEEYERRSQISSSKTIQVAISIKADNSMMLLYGAGGVRYKRSGAWVDVTDVGMMDNPLGYVNKENSNIEYSLDEILEEAMFVREQYCSTILIAALEAEQQQSNGSEKTLSPPSLAKSIVSTPPRSNYYYDGSSNDTKVEEDDEEEEEEMEARKLDFLSCISPSSMAKGSMGTIPNFAQRQKKRRRKQVYRFFQRLVMVVGFYICAIFLVGNLCGIDYNLFRSILPQSHNTMFTMFIKNGETKDRGETAMERIQRDHDTLVQQMAEERDTYKHSLEVSKKVLREQEAQNQALSKKYDTERARAEELQSDKEDALALVENLLEDTETLAVNLKMEQGQRRQLEQTIQELQIQLTSLIQDKIRMETLLEEAAQQAEENLVELSLGKNQSLQDPTYEEAEVTEELLLASPPNARHSINILKSDKNKIEVFASSLKTAVTKNFKKILRKKNQSESQLWQHDLPDSVNDAFLAQYRPLKFLDDNKAIREMLKTSTQKLFKEGRENSGLVRRNARKNVDEVSIAGIKKMDHGKEAIKVVGDFAKNRLQSVGKRARKFANRKWGLKQKS